MHLSFIPTCFDSQFSCQQSAENPVLPKIAAVLAPLVLGNFACAVIGILFIVLLRVCLCGERGRSSTTFVMSIISSPKNVAKNALRLRRWSNGKHSRLAPLFPLCKSPKKNYAWPSRGELIFCQKTRALHVFFHSFCWEIQRESGLCFPVQLDYARPGFVQLPDSCWRCCLLFLNYIKYLKHMQIWTVAPWFLFFFLGSSCICSCCGCFSCCCEPDDTPSVSQFPVWSARDESELISFRIYYI